MGHFAVVLCYHLTAGPLAETLIMWSRQTDVTSVYSYKSLEGYTSPGFEGCTNPLALLERLMPAQWTYEVTSPTTVTIEPIPECDPEAGVQAPLPPCLPPALEIPSS